MKKELPYCMTGKAIKGYDESVIAKGETNDCVVRAFASCFELSYDKAHKYVKEKFGRKDRQGTYGTVITMMNLVLNRTQVNYKRIKRLGTPQLSHLHYSLQYSVKVNGCLIFRNMTVGTFIKKNPVGTFLSWLKVTHLQLKMVL
jgi:hypothetical protein